MKEKKSFWESRIFKILLAIVPIIIKNQKGIKGTNKVETIDNITEVLK